MGARSNSPPPPLFVARATADLSGGSYSFQEAWHTGGAWADKAGGIYGGAANPARAITGLTLAVNDYFLCRSAPGEGGLSYEALAKIPGPGSAVTGTGTDNHVVRWDGATAVQDSYAQISDAGVFTVADKTTFAGTDAYVQVYCSSAGDTATLVLAPVGVSGGFVDQFFIQAAGSGSNLTSATIEAQFALASMCSLTGTLLVLSTFKSGVSGFTDSYGWQVNGGADQTNEGFVSAWAFMTGVTDYTAMGGGTLYSSVYLMLGTNADVGGGFREYKFLTADDTKKVKLTVQHLGVEYPGVTGTPGPGFQVKGGVVTDGGSGSFVSTAAANVFTAAQTIVPATDVVPLTLQGGGAGTAHLQDWNAAAGANVGYVGAAGDVHAASFAGDGSALTGLNASNVASGTLANTRLRPEIPAGALLSLFRGAY